ncbi:uncharacterized protein LOC124596372 [Schistocerca americana]|uniref:uncharacterized protein LOC124596372 n=1 Tax=Schistocerca americana TaxID=7009 RepID=UPI001F4F36CD|nr:uncharacterized protein LOC124596372 [Schistocerca americana]
MPPLSARVLLLAAAACCGVAARPGARLRPRSHGTLCMCDDKYEPVCASNLYTYNNLCAYQCATAHAYPVNLFMLHAGPCNDKDRNTVIGLDVEPYRAQSAPQKGNTENRKPGNGTPSAGTPAAGTPTTGNPTVADKETTTEADDGTSPIYAVSLEDVR